MALYGCRTTDFVERLLQAIRDSGRAVRLVHISIPGTAAEDRTAFSATKREAERLIEASGIAYTILRPGFVIAPSAYGGSALLRALATLRDRLDGIEDALEKNQLPVVHAWLDQAKKVRDALGS